MLAQELHKPRIKKFIRRKGYLRFKYNTFAEDLTEMGSLFYSNFCFKYLLCVVHVSSKHSVVNPLTNKKGKTILNGFIEIINESIHKPNRLRSD